MIQKGDSLVFIFEVNYLNFMISKKTQLQNLR